MSMATALANKRPAIGLDGIDDVSRLHDYTTVGGGSTF